MKKLLLSATLTTLLTSTALAADLPSRKESVVTPNTAPVWQGFYTGLNSGYGFGTANNAQQTGWANPDGFPTKTYPLAAIAFASANSYMGRDITQSGYIGGGQIGYNHQYGQNLVFGFEADMQGAGIAGQGNSRGVAPVANNSSYGNILVGSNSVIQAGINWMGTARGRVGYLITPTVLAYATGGLAYGGTYVKNFNISYEATTGGTSALSNARINSFWNQNAQQNFNVGWTAGGGFEWMMAANWSLKGEALYYDLGNTTLANIATYSTRDTPAFYQAGGSNTRAYYQGVIARAGVNYHFNLGSIAAQPVSPILVDELPSRKEVATPANAQLWQGYYIGLNSGYGFGTANNAQQTGWANPGWFKDWSPDTAVTGPAALAGVNSFMGRDITQGGFIGGGQIGYNHQYGQNFVLGFEADMQGSGIAGQGISSGVAPYNYNWDQGTRYMLMQSPLQAGINWMGTARARIGYLVAPSVLLYATGGLAYGGTYLKTFPTIENLDTGAASPATTNPWFVYTQNAQQNFNVGWTAGGGFEWMMAANWSLKGEALYYDLGNTSVSNTAYQAYSSNVAYNPVGGSTTRAYYQGVIARGGVNYHFNLDSMPVVAKF